MMNKKAFGSLFLLLSIVISSGFCVKGIGFEHKLLQTAYQMKIDESIFAEEKSSAIEICSSASSEQRIVDYLIIRKEEEETVLSSDELSCLYRIVEAEAGCEDEEGKLLVANVVFNRVNSGQFPDTVTDVVMQSDNGVTQFSPVSNGCFWKVSISDETVRAVERALSGEDISQGALYFAARKYADSNRMEWFDKNLTYLYTHGGHEFFAYK